MRLISITKSISKLFLIFAIIACVGCIPKVPVTVTGGASNVVEFEKSGSKVTSVSINQNTSINDVKIVINGSTDDAANYVFSITSDNQTLLPNDNIVITGDGKFRSLTISPVLGESGQATLTGTVTNIVNNKSVIGTLLFIVLADNVSPVLTEVTPVPSVTTNVQPSYIFHSNEAGVITYSGSCTSATTTAINGNNTVTFNKLAAGSYNNCAIKVTDSEGNASELLLVPGFKVVGPGFVITDFNSGSDSGKDVILQSDGKIIVVGSSNGDNAVARYNTDGSLDLSFDYDGKVTTNIYAYGNLLWSVALQNDEKIVACGRSASTNNSNSSDFTLVRYNTDGSLDTSFSADGKLTTDIGTKDDGCEGVVIQPNGKIVAAGYTYNGSNFDFALARYNTDGSLDTSFSGDGKQTLDMGTSQDVARGIALQSDGKILVVGARTSSTNIPDFALARYNSDGSLDTGFSGDGWLTTDMGSNVSEEAHNILVQVDGKILVSGESYNGANLDFALIRYNTDGSLDTSFGVNGKLISAFGSGNDRPYGMKLQSDGKILISGQSATASKLDHILVRYNVDGSLDTSFSNDGFIKTSIGSTQDIGWGVAIQSDGKVVMTGYTNNGSNTNFVLLRHNIDGNLDDTFGAL